MSNLRTILLTISGAMGLLNCSAASEETASDSSSSETSSSWAGGEESTTVTGANLSSTSSQCAHTRIEAEALNIATCQLTLQSGASLAGVPDGFVYAERVVNVDVQWTLEDSVSSRMVCSTLQQGVKLFCFENSVDLLPDNFSVSALLTALDTGTTFEIEVVSEEVSESSGVAATVPSAPTLLSAAAASFGQINLSWTDNADDEVSMILERGTDGISFSSLAVLGSGTETYEDTTVAASSTYYYRVKACNEEGCSEVSNTDNATTPSVTHTVFVTSTLYNGNLGGLAGADAKCQARADAQSLGGTWKAIISAAGVDAKDHITVSYAVYNTNNVKIADNSAELWGGTLEAAVARDEGGSVVGGRAWTGSDGVGNEISTQTCINWGDSFSGNSGNAGDPSLTNTNWMNAAIDTCDATRRLYCIDGQ